MILNSLILALSFCSIYENNATNILGDKMVFTKEKNMVEDYSFKQNLEYSLVRKTVLKDLFSILIPSDFTLMTIEEKRLKYPGTNAPQEVWANSNRSVTVNFSNTGQSLPVSELETYVNVVSKSIKESLPNSNWYGSEIKYFNGLKVGVIKFESPAVDGNIYNIMCITIIKGQVVIYSFNYLINNETQWSEIGKSIIESLKI